MTGHHNYLLCHLSVTFCQTEPHHYHSAKVLRSFLVVFVVIFFFRDILKIISQVPLVVY